MINFVAINSLDELTYESNGHDFSSLILKQLSFKYPVFQVPGFYVNLLIKLKGGGALCCPDELASPLILAVKYHVSQGFTISVMFGT